MWIGRLLFQARGLLRACPKSFGANLFPFLSKNRFYRSCDWKTVFSENGQERDRWSPLAVFNETGMWNITFDWSFRSLWMVSASYRLGSKNIKNNHCIGSVQNCSEFLHGKNHWFHIIRGFGLRWRDCSFVLFFSLPPICIILSYFLRESFFYWSLNGNTIQPYIISKYFVTAYKSSDHNK